MFGELMALRRPSAPRIPSDEGPSFPLYLLPSLRIPFRRRRLTGPTSSPRTTTTTTTTTTPELATPGSSTVPSLSSSPVSPTVPDSPASQTDHHNRHHHHPSASARRLSRAQPETLRCRTCATDLAFHAQIISKGFMGRYGRAYLVAPPSPRPAPSCPGSPLNADGDPESTRTDLINVRVGRPEVRQLVTGTHVVADISCVGCGGVVGWKYVDARDPGQRYKVGKFILESRRVVGFRSWEDVDVGVGVQPPAPPGLWSAEREGKEEDDGDVVVFDSEDEDECEDIFAAVWDPRVAARRRTSKAASMLRRGGGGGGGGAA